MNGNHVKRPALEHGLAASPKMAATLTCAACIALLFLHMGATAATADVAPLWEDDFETNLDPVSREPDGWEQLTGRWYPEYNQIVFPDTETTHSGKAAVRFKLLGGNMAMEHAAFLPITQGRTYCASGWIRTASLRKSVAYLSLELYDKKGFPLKHYACRSHPVEGTSDWVLAEARIERPAADAAFMRVRCNLEGGDISGSAWFDEIRVVEQTWIELDTSPTPCAEPTLANTGSIFKDAAPSEAKPQPIRAIVKLHGAEPGNHLVEIRCSDFMGSPVAQPILRQIRVDETGSHDLPVELELQKRGYARVDITVSKLGKDGVLVMTGSHRTSVGILDSWVLQRSKSTWIGSDINPYAQDAHDLVSLLKLAGVKRAVLRVWNEAMPPLDNALAAPELDTVLAACASAGIELIGGLGTPSLWARRATFSGQSADGQSLFLLGENVWRQPLVASLQRLKTHVSMWLFGAPGSTDLSTAPFASKLANVVRSVVQFPELGIPVSAVVETAHAPQPLRAADGFTFVTIHVTAGMSPDLLPDAISQWKEMASKQFVNVALLPVETGAAGSSAARQLSDMALRLGAVRAAGASQAFVTPLQDASCGLVDEFGKPTAAFYTLLVMNRALSNKTFDPRRIFSRNIDHMVFKGADESAVLLWRAQSDDSAGTIENQVSIGDEVRLLDLDGRMSEPKRKGSMTFVDVGDVPRLLVGLNPAFLDMQLSITIDPPAIDSVEGKQKVSIRVFNAFPSETVSSLNIRADFPQEWSVTRSTRTIPQLSAGAAAALTTEVSMPLREILGTKEIPITIQFVAGGKEFTGKVIRPLQVKCELTTNLQIERTRDGTVCGLVLSVRNLGERYVDVKCHVQAPDVPLREIPMRALAPASVRVQQIPLSIRPNTHGIIYVHVVEEGGRRLFLNDRIEY
jgi:hypothetical protein